MMGLQNRGIRVVLLACASLAGTATLPSIASAGDSGGRFHDARNNDRDNRSDREAQRADDRGRDYDARAGDRDRSHTDVRIDINLGRTRYEPVYEEWTTRVWVETAYRTVCDRVWVAPVYRTECDRVWEPDRYAHRDVVYHERGHRVIRREHVLVERGHWREFERQVLVCEGRWENVERQELVSPGHWEYRTERVQVSGARFGDPGVDLFASLSR